VSEHQQDNSSTPVEEQQEVEQVVESVLKQEEPVKSKRALLGLVGRVAGCNAIFWAVLVWCLFSVPFVGYMGWSYLQEQVYQAGVQDGAVNASNTIYKDIIAKAANEQCNTIFVKHENQRVDLVNVRCLEIVQQEQAVQGSEQQEQAVQGSEQQ